MQDLEKIVSFLQKHHVMSLATCDRDGVHVCSLFYAYDKLTNHFVVASSEETKHIKQIKINNKVAGNIHLETKKVGLIQGVQFVGVCDAIKDERLKKIYFKRFPYSKMMNPMLWQINVKHFKMTDNKLGFGKKIKVDL